MIGSKRTKFARSSVDKLAPTLPLMITKVDLLRSKKKKNQNNCKMKVLVACITLLILGSVTIFQGHRLTPF